MQAAAMVEVQVQCISGSTQVMGLAWRLRTHTWLVQVNPVKASAEVLTPAAQRSTLLVHVEVSPARVAPALV